ncbi:MAG: NUDIX hydrolase [Verrucomicrobia bacterium RIFCSPLOWO2_12_FULL_64_8]|nr:MAG: NUDIX hydrolase [Verrucomicrobia bacterium RIFCSPLOWO2_12_FULL_64_8]
MPPTEDWLDVVDEHDRVVGRAPRHEVHARGLRHRAVHVLVFNRAGDVFLQKRSMHKDTAPGAWDSSASGHVDAGEDYDGCAARELREELGVAPSGNALRRWLHLPACAETGHEFVWVYRHESEGPFTLPPAEIERGDWFAPAAVTRLVADRPGEFAGSFRLVWRTLQELGQAPRGSKTMQLNHGSPFG